MKAFRELLINRLPEGSFVRNVATLMSGTAVAQGLVVFCTPILTRIYSPEAFGILTVFTAVTSVLTIISCARYELAIVLPDDDSVAVNLFAISILMSLITTVFTIVCVVLLNYSSFTNILFLGDHWQSWIWYVPICLFVSGIFQALNYWATRRKQFRSLAMRQVTQSITMIIVQILIGCFMLSKANGLIIGMVFGQVIATSLLFIQIWKEDGNLIISKIQYSLIKDAIRSYKKFPLYSTWASLLNTLSPQLPVFFLTNLSLSAAGYFGLANRIVGLPMSLVGSSVAQVFFADASEQLNKHGNCTYIYKSTVKRLFALGSAFSVVVALLSFVMGPIFGDKWQPAGIVLLALIPLFFIRFLSSPVSSVFYIRQRQDLDLVVTVVFAVVPIIAFMLSERLGWSFLSAIVIYSLLMALSYGLQLILGKRLSINSTKFFRSEER